MTEVLILMGSPNDHKTMRKAQAALNDLGVSSEMHVASAHRDPSRVEELVSAAEGSGKAVAIICGAGMAAHLAGAVAARKVLPVIGVPLSGSPLGGADALHSTVQMPRGVPVATVAIDGAQNAGILAAQIAALHRADVREALRAARVKSRDEARARSIELAKE